MTGDVVNLRTARKRKERKDRETKAEQNRISFGRTKAERQRTDAENERTGSSLVAAKSSSASSGSSCISEVPRATREVVGTLYAGSAYATPFAEMASSVS